MRRESTVEWLNRRRGLLVLLLLLLLFAGWRLWSGHFTPERWAQAEEGERGAMVEDMLRQYDGLVGMTADQVTGLLGGELGETWRQAPGQEPEYFLAYYLGSSRGMFRLFPEFLHVYFEDGVVSGTEFQIA